MPAKTFALCKSSFSCMLVLDVSNFFIYKTLLFLINMCYPYFYSSETSFKHSLIIKLYYQIFTVASAK